MEKLGLLTQVGLVTANHAANQMQVELAQIAPIEKVVPQGAIALVECPQFDVAKCLVNNLQRVAQIAKNYWFDYLLISWPGCPNAVQISSSFAHGEHSEPTIEESGNLFIPQLDLTFDDFYYGETPLYINDWDKTVVFANNAALKAQTKNRRQFFGESVYLLNPDVEELDRRVERVESGQDLFGYSYTALRWFFDSDAETYRRKQMRFSSNFGQVSFLGEKCWFSMVLDAQPTGAIVAGV